MVGSGDRFPCRPRVHLPLCFRDLVWNCLLQHTSNAKTRYTARQAVDTKADSRGGWMVGSGDRFFCHPRVHLPLWFRALVWNCLLQRKDVVCSKAGGRQEERFEGIRQGGNLPKDVDG
jgi:hypothetical protein